MKVYLIQRKITEIEDLCKSILQEGSATLHELAKLLGMLVAASAGVPFVPVLTAGIRYQMRKIIIQITAKGMDPWRSKTQFPLSEAVIAEATFWSTSIPEINGRPFHRPYYDKDIFVDTSDTVAASICDETYTHIPLPLTVRTTSSTFRELYGALCSIVSRRHAIEGKAVRLITDSAATVAIMNRNGSNIEELVALCRLCVSIQLQYDISISWRWQRRSAESITLCDKISKTPNLDSWQFNTEMRDAIIGTLQWPKPTVDACASAEDTTLERYISAEWDGSAIATDLLSAATRRSLDWSKEVLWINPPFTDRLIEGIMEVVLSTKVHAMIVIPNWVRHAFWRNACEKCCQMVHVGRSKHVFRPSSQYSFAKKKPNWDSTLFGFNFEPKLAVYLEWTLDPIKLTVTPNRPDDPKWGKHLESGASSTLPSERRRKRRRRK
jgi:hypothetical protein